MNFRFTSNQNSIVDQIIKLLPEFKILVLKGDGGTGKHSIINEVISRLGSHIHEFNIFDIMTDINHVITNQDIHNYLDKLISISNLSKKPKHDKSYDKPYDKSYNIIYIRNYHKITEVLSDAYMLLRNLLPHIITNFANRLSDNYRIIVTTQHTTYFGLTAWTINLTNDTEDIKEVLTELITNKIIDVTESENILRISKKVNIGRLLTCIKYANALRNNDDDNFLSRYNEAYTHLCGSSTETDCNVPKPIVSQDLIGLDDIMEEIKISIINPINLGIKGVSIKKGLLLCGPMGTGKTSIGRWLAHEIKGRFFLLGSEAGISGSTFIDYFENVMARAKYNSPAVIFIDDCDVLFTHDDTYRLFLTILDGLDNNKRKDICVIITCMNLKLIPASLIRGGRLEMVLMTKLPDSNVRCKIIEESLNNMVSILSDYNKDNNIIISNNLIKSLSIKMNNWNCADIKRCVQDVTRSYIYDPKKNNNLSELFDKSINNITRQYELCGQIEATSGVSKTDTYIM